MVDRKRPKNEYGAVEEADGGLLRVLDADWEAVRARAGAHLACRRGCSDCCHGPFPITRLDALRLRVGLERLARRDPDRAAAIRRRAEAAVERLHEGFVGDADTGRLDGDERRLDAFLARHATLPCPALDPDDGACTLHDARPVACRVYGPPTRFGDERSPPCDLCFVDADPATVEACRWEPDVGGIEEWILERLGVRAGEEWETLIAHVLAGAADPCADSGKVAAGGDDGGTT